MSSDDLDNLNKNTRLVLLTRNITASVDDSLQLVIAVRFVWIGFLKCKTKALGANRVLSIPLSNMDSFSAPRILGILGLTYAVWKYIEAKRSPVRSHSRCYALAR
jgi:hypothetical protein